MLYFELFHSTFTRPTYDINKQEGGTIDQLMLNKYHTLFLILCVVMGTKRNLCCNVIIIMMYECIYNTKVHNDTSCISIVMLTLRNVFTTSAD